MILIRLHAIEEISLNFFPEPSHAYENCFVIQQKEQSLFRLIMSNSEPYLEHVS